MAKLSTSLNTQSWEDTHPISSHKPGRSNSSPPPYLLLPFRDVYEKEGGNCFWKLCLPNGVETLCVPPPPPAGPGSLCSSGRGPDRQPVTAAETEAERERACPVSCWRQWVHQRVLKCTHDPVCACRAYAHSRVPIGA